MSDDAASGAETDAAPAGRGSEDSHEEGEQTVIVTNGEQTDSTAHPSQEAPSVQATPASPEQTKAVPAAEPEAPPPGAFPSESPVPTVGPISSKRISQGLMSPPLTGHGRQRSVSPGRFPVAVRDPSPAASTSGRESPVKGLTGDMPPPSTAERAANVMGPPTLERKNSSDVTSPPPQPGGLARKASSGFGALLGRMGSIRKNSKTSPGPSVGLERRNTGASSTSTDGTPAVTPTPLSAIADGPEGEALGRPSLQDRFATLRKQEEQSHESVFWDGENDRTSSERQDSHADAPTSPGKENGEPKANTDASTSALKSPPLNPSLPPGTASGMTAGPSAEQAPVNWDLWQNLVYEGPTAVQRTSGDELSKAIASGIPPAIRGVVWQVLADSKSEDLEALYKTLKARGTDADTSVKPPPLNRADSSFVGGAEKEKESVASSGSSVHSDSSTPATTVTTPPPSLDGASVEQKVKLLAEKQKRDAAALAKLEKTIKRDLGARTSYSKYAQSAGLQDGLFGVCKAYALFDDTVGYAQGINFVAMPLLFNMSEEEAFTLLVRLMHKYNLRSLFEPEMPGLHLRLYQFERLLEDLEPALYCHLRRRGVKPDLYATQWFLTLFAYRFPLQLVLRVYDLLFSEGLTAILKFGIVLMRRNRAALMEMRDMSQLTTFLKEKIFDVYIDKSPSASSLLDSGFFGSVSGGADKELYRADEMVRDACDVVVSDEVLAAYTLEWETQEAARKDADLEAETLRASNAHLTQRVRILEERAQQHDTEHVGIASDLVRLKVENDTLLDDNEGLKVRVKELEAIVDAQPAEVEEKLKEEMERILGRNGEVQGQNRVLREELDEVEREFVECRMRLAQVSFFLLFFFVSFLGKGGLLTLMGYSRRAITMS